MIKRNISNELTVFVISCGNNPNYLNCLKALEAQTVSFKIDIIKDYSPMPVAFQEMLNRCTTKYYIEVDEDMILDKTTVEKMYNDIKVTDSKKSMLCYLLNDVHLSFDIYGVKIYKYNIFKKYPYDLNCLSCEVQQLEIMKKDGYIYDCLPIVVGKHSPLWNDSDIFERYFNLMEKFKEFGYSWLEDLPNKLIKIILQNPTTKNIYALLGAYTSIIKKDISKEEKDYTKVKREEFGIIEGYLSQPVSATIYMTSECNYKCEWCYRQYHEIEYAPDFDIEKVNLLLDRFPSIRGVCICGFGETFMSPNLPYVIEALKEKNIFVGVITNGSYLEDKLPVLLCRKEKWIPNYISVSLNAPNAEIHKKITGTNMFDKVINGIKLSLSNNIETYVSYVCTRNNMIYIPEFLSLMKSIGIKTVNLHNLLPHFNDDKNDKFWDEVLQKKDSYLIDDIKKIKDSDIIKIYPTLIDKNETRRYCQFPWSTIAMNGNGNISICNSVYPCDAKNGNIKDNILWQNKYCRDFRHSILNEQYPVCKKCFRNWKID